VTLRAHPYDVGIGRVYADPRDLLRLSEPERRPRLAAIGGLPDSVAGRDVAPDGVLAGADIHDVRVRLETPIAPMVPPKYLSVAAAHVSPPSVVLNTPPPVVPIQNSATRDAEPATATLRPRGRSRSRAT